MWAFFDALAQVVERNIDGSVNGIQGVFLFGARVDDGDCLAVSIAQLSPVNHRHRAVDDVAGYVACNGDRVLGRGEGRRISLLQSYEVGYSPFSLDDEGQLVDAFVGSVVTNALCTIELSGLGIEG